MGKLEKLLRKKDALEADVRDLTSILKNLKDSIQKSENQMCKRRAELKSINCAIRDLNAATAANPSRFLPSKPKDQQGCYAGPKFSVPLPPRPDCYKCMESGHYPDDCPEDLFGRRRLD